MKVRLLKKLRRSAYKLYGLVYADGEYLVGTRHDIETYNFDICSPYPSLEIATTELHKLRIRKISNWVANAKRNRKVAKLNKELSKL